MGHHLAMVGQTVHGDSAATGDRRTDETAREGSALHMAVLGDDKILQRTAACGDTHKTHGSRLGGDDVELHTVSLSVECAAEGGQ